MPRGFFYFWIASRGVRITCDALRLGCDGWVVGRGDRRHHARSVSGSAFRIRGRVICSVFSRRGAHCTGRRESVRVDVVRSLSRVADCHEVYRIAGSTGAHGWPGFSSQKERSRKMGAVFGGIRLRGDRYVAGRRGLLCAELAGARLPHLSATSRSGPPVPRKIPLRAGSAGFSPVHSAARRGTWARPACASTAAI